MFFWLEGSDSGIGLPRRISQDYVGSKYTSYEVVGSRII